MEGDRKAPRSWEQGTRKGRGALGDPKEMGWGRTSGGQPASFDPYITFFNHYTVKMTRCKYRSMDLGGCIDMWITTTSLRHRTSPLPQKTPSLFPLVLFSMTTVVFLGNCCIH